jgi:multiple sugar transport system permease protein
MRSNTKKQNTIVIILLVLGGIIMSFPFFWMIISSFKPERELFTETISIFPKNPTLEHYTNLIENMKFITYLKNTLIIVFFAFIGLFFNALAGYAFAKFDFLLKEKLFLILLSTMMIPGQVTMIPNYLLLNKFDLTNTMAGIVLPGMASGFAIFLFRQFMSTIPTDLIEASRLDGAGELRIFLQIILPVAKPIIAVQSIMTFIGSWNSFLWPLIMANDENLYTLSVGLSLLKGQYRGDYALQMAGASFMVIPVVIVFIIFQNQIIDGHTMSGIK